MDWQWSLDAGRPLHSVAGAVIGKQAGPPSSLAAWGTARADLRYPGVPDHPKQVVSASFPMGWWGHCSTRGGQPLSCRRPQPLAMGVGLCPHCFSGTPDRTETRLPSSARPVWAHPLALTPTTRQLTPGGPGKAWRHRYAAALDHG